MSVLTVSEYSSIAIGDISRADVARVCVSPGQHAALDRFSRSFMRQHRVEPLELRLHGVRTRQYVGVMPMGNGTLEVLPKFDLSQQVVSEIDQSRNRRNLLRMLAATRKLPIRDVDAQRLGHQPHDLLEIILRLFCDRLFDQVRRGMVHRYEALDENLTCVRGRIVMAKHLRFNAFRGERIHCEFDEFSPDNVTNQVLKAALRIVLDRTRVEETRRRARELMFIFDGVTPRNIRAEDFARVPRDRTLGNFAALLELAETIVLGPYPDVLVGERKQIALLFDMANLFEEYIGRIIQGMASDLQVSVQLQGPQKWLAKEGEATDRFQLRPDITLHRDGKVVLVADTKWKRLDNKHPTLGIDQADIYQMLAYAKTYKCARIALLYPECADDSLDSVKRKYTIENISIEVIGLDLRELDIARDQLQNYLAAAVLEAE